MFGGDGGWRASVDTVKRTVARKAAYRLLSVADPYRAYHLHLGSPPSGDVRPRWGYGRPPHPLINAALAEHESVYVEQLRRVANYRSELRRIPVHAETGSLHWVQEWLPGLDTAVLYTQLRDLRPRRYLEVGSGNSTLVAHRAVVDGGLDTEIVSIDPQPRVEVDAICDRVIRRPLESVDLDELTYLGPDDLLFVDASHRVFQNSDMVAFYLDILPRLHPGLLVGIHDILWPADYLPEWSSYWFSDQYLLGAYLLAPTPWIEPVLACAYAHGQPHLAELVESLWEGEAFSDVDRGGSGFWFRVGTR